MVFGLFSRKREPAPTVQPSASAGAFPSQLRTPSPSVVDKQSSPTREPPLTPSPPPEARNPAELCAYIQSIPPQTLHAYTISRLHPSNTLDPDTLAHISAFFAHLAPPPKLHCVRCHKGYFEIENTDRSCLVAHDDESAEVERVSAKAKGKGTLYETLWNCCGKTVEGDGDMGPPDGWCYEGQHTTDIKRARFRADSTMHDDKLVSCERLRCGMPPRSSRTTRKRGRDEGDEEDERSSVTSSHPSTNTSPRSSNGRKKPRTRASPTDEHEPDPTRMDIDIDNPTPSASASISAHAPPSPNPTPKLKPKPKSSRTAKPKSTPSKPTSTTPKTSSPLVLSPPFISRPSSPERKIEVVIKSSSAFPSPGGDRTRKDSGSSVKRERMRKDSSASRAGGKVKGLDEVVDSSVDAERAMGWVAGAGA